MPAADETPAAARKLQTSSLWEEDVHRGTHIGVWGGWYDAEKKAWGYGCCRGLRYKRLRCPTTLPPGETLDDEDEEDEREVRVSQRVADMLERCPGFSGDVPTPAQEQDWTEAELHNYIYSNGLIRPSRKRKGDRPEPKSADWKALELEPGADLATAKKAYRRLALKHHPDKHQGEAEKAQASDRFKRIAEAFEAIAGHAAEVPALPAADTAPGVKRKRWRLVVVEP
eukprot:TRINITY_DN28359_c0_g1_i1.p1 TRINITY_DN28359_c0_g1~~TRINITY_DN28359_c0_g1_i1.p1  ORF type:complete len:227 (-),score=56.11 TRINITY_DN28359_c0_g1_i1:48-728(-)